MTSRRRIGRLRVVVDAPRVQIRRSTAAGPDADAREGSTGTPRRTIRVSDVLWGAALNAVAARNRRDPGLDLDVSKLVRGWLAAFVRGELEPMP